MTPALVAVALTLLTAALLAEEWHWRRTHRPVAQRPVRGRCLVCVPAVHVDDIFVHSRLVHARRAVGAEDMSEWAS